MSLLATLSLTAALLSPQNPAPPAQELQDALEIAKIGAVDVKDLMVDSSTNRQSIIVHGKLTPARDWEKALLKQGFKRHNEFVFIKQILKTGNFQIEVSNYGEFKDFRAVLEYPATNAEPKQFDFTPVANGTRLYSILPGQGSTCVLIPPTYNWAFMRLPDLQHFRAIKGEGGMRYQDIPGWYIFCWLHKEGAKNASVDMPTEPHLRIGMDRVER